MLSHRLTVFIKTLISMKKVVKRFACIWCNLTTFCNFLDGYYMVKRIVPVKEL